MAKYRLLAVTVAVLLTIALAASTAWASTVPTNLVDPQIFIQDSGTSPAGGDPNVISNTGSFVVGVAGSATLQDPLLIIVGVYDGNGVPSISFSGCPIPSDCPAATLTTYGLTANTALFTSVSIGSAYDQLGLGSGGSESFGNWSNADVAFGFAAPTSFTLYAFELPGNLTAGSPFSIDESGAAAGSFIIGYSCDDGTGTSSGCKKPGNRGQTPFTNAGLLSSGPIQKVPEPAGLAMLGSGLVLIGGLLRRKLRTSA